MRYLFMQMATQVWPHYIHTLGTHCRQDLEAQDRNRLILRKEICSEKSVHPS